MKLNKKLLPIKLHYFLFMAAMGPILPQLPLLGKDIGISSPVMGIINGILPIFFLISKPIFGLVVDVYRDWRKTLFIMLIVVMVASFGGLYFIPSQKLLKFQSDWRQTYANNCDKNSVTVECNSTCLSEPIATVAVREDSSYQICLQNINQTHFSHCCFECVVVENLYRTFTFWIFIALMSLGTIGFNIINSVSDAICFDSLDIQTEYGKQRLWGSIGFGLSGLISGYIVNLFSISSNNYEPVFIIMILFTVLDILVCLNLKLPIIKPPENIFRNLRKLLESFEIVVFFIFTILAGMLDGIIIYYLFWYLEDLAVEVNTTQIKLIEGLILAAETMGAETLFFLISENLGYVKSFSLCFINYGIRLVVISILPSPWWFVPIELMMQGPTFALSYSTIVAYANDIAPAGMSATLQGIAAGLCEGTGFSIGSLIGGLSYKYIGGRLTFQIFSAVAFVCGVLHFVIHNFICKKNRRVEYEEI